VQSSSPLSFCLSVSQNASIDAPTFAFGATYYRDLTQSVVSPEARPVTVHALRHLKECFVSGKIPNKVASSVWG